MAGGLWGQCEGQTSVWETQSKALGTRGTSKVELKQKPLMRKEIWKLLKPSAFESSRKRNIPMLLLLRGRNRAPTQSRCIPRMMVQA